MKQSLEGFRREWGSPLPVAECKAHYTAGRDLSIMLTMAKRWKPSKVLELSCAYGDTAVNLAGVLPSESRVFAFDVCREMGTRIPPTSESNHHEILPRSEVGSSIQKAPEGIREKIHLFVARGEDISTFVKATHPYDFAYIDGGHTWRFVANDTKLVLETSTPDAVIVWDDYWDRCPEVRHFLNLLNRRVGNLLVFVEGSKLCYIVLNEEKRRKLQGAVDDL